MVSSHAGSDSGHREGTATTRCREEERQQDALMFACANLCGGYRVVLAHSLLTMGHSTRRAGGFVEICPLRNERLGSRVSSLFLLIVVRYLSPPTNIGATLSVFGVYSTAMRSSLPQRVHSSSPVGQVLVSSSGEVDRIFTVWISGGCG